MEMAWHDTEPVEDVVAKVLCSDTSVDVDAPWKERSASHLEIVVVVYLRDALRKHGITTAQVTMSASNFEKIAETK